MHKLVAPISSALLTGFILGNLSARYGFYVFTLDTSKRYTISKPLTHGTEEAMSSRERDVAASPDEDLFPENHEPLPIADESYPPVPDPHAWGEPSRASWKARYPNAPPLNPPHIADRYFFGEPEDPDIMRIRIEALETHIEALREAGVPETDIRQVLQELERERTSPAEQVLRDETIPILDEPVEGNGSDPERP